jgi:hypothetical protein
MASLGACGNKTVSEKMADRPGRVDVSAAPASVHVNYFDKPPAGAVERDRNFDAYTLWFYHCFADIQMQPVDADDTIGASSAHFVVKNIQLRLSCPINIWLPRNAQAVVRDHEDGHSEICKKVYLLAPAVARKAAEDILGKSYSGMGANLAEAKQVAMSAAKEDIAQAFRSGVIERADEISVLYDDFAARQMRHDMSLPQKPLAEAAYQRVIKRVPQEL